MWQSPLYFVSSADSVLRTTGVGPETDPVLVVHFWFATAYWGPWSLPSSVCRWHPSLWSLPSVCNAGASEQHLYLHRRSSQADALQSAPAEYSKDRGSLIYIQSQSATRVANPIRVGTYQVMPVSVFRNLVIYMDAAESVRSHVSKTVAACFAMLRQLRSIRRSDTRSVLQSLVSSVVLQWLDYGNATMAGIPSHLTKRMQSALNSAARFVFSASRYDHITPLLTQLHWLKVP